MAQALARRVVAIEHQLIESFTADVRQVDLPCQHPAHASGGVLHPSLLPRRVGVAEEGLHSQVVETVMPGEFRSVVESHAAAPLGREWRPWRVRTPWRCLWNSIRSASQCPGVRRSFASSGRWDRGRRYWMKEAGLLPLRPRRPLFDLPLGRRRHQL